MNGNIHIYRWWIIIIAIGIFSLPSHGAAATQEITLQYKHFIAKLQPDISWYTRREVWKYHENIATPPSEWKSCSRAIQILPEGWKKEFIKEWNTPAITASIELAIGKDIHQEPGDVHIYRTTTGSIAFDGIGLPGRTIDGEKSAALIIQALRNGDTTIQLPVIETPPTITVSDPELQNLGIQEVVTIGESSFLYSPENRRHNILTGLKKLNGILIPKNTIFSFNTALGPITARTGYKEELVIKGDVTVPDFGGGLCQVSSTVYRGAWEYGLPILQRSNHSYIVRYYAPIGTDATVFAPGVDMRFMNNTSGALLLQTFTDKNDRAYTIFYGTKDNRMSEIFGPFTWDHIPAPLYENIVTTTEIPPGAQRKAGEKHDGLKAAWFRRNTKDNVTNIERFFSVYEARPATIQIGVAPSTGTGVKMSGKDNPK